MDEKEAMRERIADLRKRASALRQMAARADSRAERLDDERRADRLDAQASELEATLTEIARSPFHCCSCAGHDVEYVTAYDRVRAVKQFTREQCDAAMQMDGLQATVTRAIHSRLRQLAAELRRGPETMP